MKMEKLRMKRVARIGPVFLGVLVVVVALVAMNISTRARWSMTPSGPFDPLASPSVPDYDDSANWSALPDRDDADDAPPSALGRSTCAPPPGTSSTSIPRPISARAGTRLRAIPS